MTRQERPRYLGLKRVTHALAAGKFNVPAGSNDPGHTLAEPGQLVVGEPKVEQADRYISG
jgi:hypothetical protein